MLVNRISTMLHDGKQWSSKGSFKGMKRVKDISALKS